MTPELPPGGHGGAHCLKLHLARPYTAILTAGLVTSIAATIRGLQHTIASTAGMVVIGTVAFQVVLLINQLSQFHEYREANRIRRDARRRSRQDGAAPPGPPAS